MIPFTKPFLSGRELDYLAQALQGHLVGGGTFTRQIHTWLEHFTGSPKVLLTHSCTAAMEMGALLFQIQPGDEVIMPSYTFVSTANAFVLRGAVPVFVDIRPDTLNIDETRIEEAITSRTKAIAVVHYAGVSCAMDQILEIAQRHRLNVLEDAAQGIGCTYQGRALGTLGHIGAYSFHATKNIISGEGGCLLVNDPNLEHDAEVVWEKGTNRSRFIRGEVDKYTWQSVGSSFLPSELTAAFLWAQLENIQEILARRMRVWSYYHERFEHLEKNKLAQRPHCPSDCIHSGHIYYLILSDAAQQKALSDALKSSGVQAVGHYVPLHLSPMGSQYMRNQDLHVTESLWDRFIRLPLTSGMNLSEAAQVADAVDQFFQYR